MGKGTDAARAAGAGLHADVIDDFQEVDETGRFVCSFNVENGAFNFELTEKQ